MKRLNIIAMITLLALTSWSQSLDMQKIYNGRFYNLTIIESIEYMSKLTGIRFAYTTRTINDSIKLNLEIENSTLKELLDKFCKTVNLKYVVFGNQVLLKKDIDKPLKYVITGRIFETDSAAPLPYATISIRNQHVGCVSDINGNFELELKKENLKDTLTFSSMGFEQKLIPVREYMLLKDKLVYLKRITYEIPPAHVSSRDFKKITMGNNQGIPGGSLYMDTNGQQAALLIENEQGVNGKIIGLNYYLSPKGNTNAPFRVRLYKVDSITGEPGDDLLNDIVVIQPNIKKGWFCVDIKNFNIMMPDDGFYIAMEGVFPNDYDFYIGNNYFVDMTDGDQVEFTVDDQTQEITYGQRLGYTRNRKNKNNTWHYSLSHTWFQLKRQPFIIMVSADLQIRKNKEKK